MQLSDSTPLPLEKNQVFHSGDLDEARAIVAQNFCDHRLDCVAKSGRFDAVHNRAEGRSTSLNFIRYGADVEIEPGELGSFYLIQIPLTGRATIDNSAGSVDTGPGLGSVLNPHRHAAMRWHHGCSHFLLQVSADHLNHVAERLAGRPLHAPVTFQTAVDQQSASVDQWVQKLRTCFAAADKGAIYAEGNQHSQVLIEEQLIEDFLLCQPSDISALLMTDHKQVSNIHVRRAIQFIQDNYHEPMTIGDMADALQVSPRSLQIGFKSEIGQTPTQYLREFRLRQAQHLLTTAPSSVQIGDICARVGFGHFGRFSVEYKHRFGESPLETRLKNA